MRIAIRNGSASFGNLPQRETLAMQDRATPPGDRCPSIKARAVAQCLTFESCANLRTIHPCDFRCESMSDTNMKLLITRREAAASLSISVRTLDTWTKSGKIRPTRIGNRVLYSTANLQAFIDGQT